MKNNDVLEFYNGDKLVAKIDSSMVPSVGSFININKKTWVVSGVTFALDHINEAHSLRSMRANIDLTEPTE